MEDSGGGGCCCGCKLLRGLGPPPLPDDNIVDVVLGLADESLEIVANDVIVAGVVVGAMLPPAPAPPPPPDTVAALAATPATRDVTKDAKLDVQLLLLLLPPSAIAVAVIPPLITALPMTAHANGCAPKMAPEEEEEEEEEEGNTCSCNGCAKVVLLELLPLLSSDVLV